MAPAGRLMLDLCSGYKTASAVMRDRGWQVVTVDIDPALHPDIVADVRSWSWQGERPLFVWASPPCDDFSRSFLPWLRTVDNPDTSIVRACKRIIDEAKPKYWIIENVRGAARWFYPFLGNPTQIIYPFYFWGYFPPLPAGLSKIRKNKETYTSSRSLDRASIPYPLSLAIAETMEMQLDFSVFSVSPW